MVKLSRELDVRLCRINGDRAFIDEIPADHPTANPIQPSCDFLCHIAESDTASARGEWGMSLDKAALVEKAAKAIHDHWQGCGHAGSRPWTETCKRLTGQAEDFRAKGMEAVNAVLPDILEAAAKVADDEAICHDSRTSAVDMASYIARRIRVLAEATGTVQSNNLLKEKAKQ